ncbi:head-tail adaptor Ad1 [Streptomyces phage Celia]|uniref:Head-to-tail connector complex protein n=1 Tax=Streptomyces phage Celia TaxID=2590946 RepID=A0A516KR96_9CAUD|nr:head-tail adaptor Ad1 [Streptomyces phage Celia]QDP44214.1 head-to-tail connector complex protein [Streptomyces phage Celia]QFG10474.1 head-to-tail adaptor [Streptomyces phage Urza]QJD50576.1 head-to-tail adaptor [Streptomyces phage Itza]
MAYATLDDLKGRLDWTLDEDEERIAASSLEDASDLAAAYGRDWPEGSAPRLVRTLVLKAAARYMKNPDGYTQSRAGDETLAWGDAAGTDAGTVYFTDEEKKLLSELGGRRPGLSSVEVNAWGTCLRRPYRAGQRPETAGWAPTDVDGERLFPIFADDGEAL